MGIENMQNRNKMLLVIFLLYFVEVSVGVPTSDPTNIEELVGGRNNTVGLSGGYYADEVPLVTNRIKQLKSLKCSPYLKKKCVTNWQELDLGGRERITLENCLQTCKNTRNCKVFGYYFNQGFCRLLSGKGSGSRSYSDANYYDLDPCVGPKSLVAGRCEHEENWSKFLNARKAVTTDYLTDEETIPALFSKFGRSAEQRMKTNFCETVERIMGIRAIGLDQTPKGTIWPQEQFLGAKFETDEKVSFSLQQGLTCLGSQ